MRSSSTALVLSLLIGLVAGPAAARPNRIWSERNQATPPLAQVPDFRALAKQVLPCVVSIQVEQRARVSQGQRDFFNDLFRGELPREYHNRGIGTGFAITADGLILTNHHVVEEADSIQVTFPRREGSTTERKLNAELIGSAPEYDVALIRTEEPAKADICFLGDSAEIQIGDWVIAVGNPFGLSHSVSVGIISAKERRDIAPSGRRGLYNFIQTDASINPGNSGGPLINMRGEVVGINTAINAGGAGIGFAIPINMVKTLLPSLQEKGKYVRSWIGIKIQALTESLAETYGLKGTGGALVSEVVPGSPAETAGVREGDIVLEFGGKPIREQSDLPLYAGMAGIGERVDLTLWRDGKQVSKSVILSAFPEAGIEVSEPGIEESSGSLGITVADITPQLQEEFRLDQSRGVVLKEVERGSTSHRAGLRPGDIVLSLNDEPVGSARDFAEAVRKIKSGGHIRLQLRRPGGKLFVALQKP